MQRFVAKAVPAHQRIVQLMAHAGHQLSQGEQTFGLGQFRSFGTIYVNILSLEVYPSTMAIFPLKQWIPFQKYPNYLIKVYTSQGQEIVSSILNKLFLKEL
jgi:hypothetical protein